MVKEFTDLQGIVGGLYAREQGEPEQVWRAIYEHYKPLSMEDSIPRTHAGQIVALADKLDTLRECFRIGLAPTGSKDPFALRRAAQGVVKILVEGKLPFAMSQLTTHAELRTFLQTVSNIISAKFAASNTMKSAPCWPLVTTIYRTWRPASKRSATSVRRRISNRWRPASNASKTS